MTAVEGLIKKFSPSLLFFLSPPTNEIEYQVSFAKLNVNNFQKVQTPMWHYSFSIFKYMTCSSSLIYIWFIHVFIYVYTSIYICITLFSSGLFHKLSTINFIWSVRFYLAENRIKRDKALSQQSESFFLLTWRTNFLPPY